MNLIFCMAGLYKRFKDAGYAMPKFLLPFQGRTVLEHVVGEMLRSSGDAGSGPVFDHVLFVANERDRSYETHVAATLAKLGLPSASIMWVGDTSGQAKSALLGVDHLESLGGKAALGRPVVFHNIDTILTGRAYHTIAQTLRDVDGFIDCIDSDAPHFSYVRTDDAGRAIEMREKVVISRHATTGLYGFRSASDFRRWCGGVDFAKEFFISDVYRAMLVRGAHVVIGTPGKDCRTTILGTPDEYESLATTDEVRRARLGLAADAPAGSLSYALTPTPTPTTPREPAR